MSLRLPQEALDEIEAIAAGEGTSRSMVMRRAVMEWLKARRGGGGG